MEEIRISVEHLINLMGVTGPMVPVLRHVLLIVVAILLAWLSDFVCRKTLVPIVMHITRRTPTQWDDETLDRKLLITACHIVPAIVVWKLLPMVFYQYPLVREMVARLTAVYITLASVRLIVGFIDRLKENRSHRGSNARQYLQSFLGMLRILVIFIAVIVVVAILLGKNPMSLFAGLGATSAILMLVFKDTLEGLVAGVRLTSNNMLHVGDWITVSTAGINGTVTDITLTTVKVRQFDNTIMTVSPLTLVNGSFQNWKGMQQSDGRRVQRCVYFDFRSVRVADESILSALRQRKLLPDDMLQEPNVINMSLYRAFIERFLTQHDKVNNKMTLMVRQLEATQCGLPLEFYFFVKDKEWTAYEHDLADIMEHIYGFAPLFGLTIYQQYPEQ